MLRMIQNSDAKQAKRYYLSKAEYYAGGKQELPGIWGGSGADRLGLGGNVARLDFNALCMNRDPATGERLTLRDKSGRTVGYDLNFHVPKSVSILYGLTADPDILDAFRWALRATMDEIEANAKTRVRKGGRCHDRTTGNLVYSEHVHLTARPVDGMSDPHLHAHCFVFNVTLDDQENAWKAGQFRDIKRDAPYFQAAFHARLAGRLASLGYPIERTAKGWEVAGLPATLLRKFSQRTEQIERLAAEKGIVDATLKDALGAATRQRKQNDATMDELRHAWLARLTDSERDALAVAVAKQGTPSPAVSVDQAVAGTIRQCFERDYAASVPEKRLVAKALTLGVGSVTAGAIRGRLPAHGVVTQSIGDEPLCSRRQDRGPRPRDPADAERQWRLRDHLMQRQLLAVQERAPQTAMPSPRQASGHGR